MKRLAALALVLCCAGAWGATAYVSDELILNVYSELNQQGQRLTTLHSGAGVETLATSGDFTQVRLGDGTVGWVKSSFLTLHEPATVRVKQLEEELDRTRATTPGLAEAAARSEVERLQGQLAAKQSELDAARGPHADAGSAAGLAAPGRAVGAWTAAGAAAVAGGCGFWLGYVTLARRIRQKFGGLRVY